MLNQKFNPYWAIYRNIEQEVMDLSNNIYFCKEHFYVYSIKISELLVRCVVEIESISKDLWKFAGGKAKIKNGLSIEPNFDSDCLNFIDQKWSLSKKEIKLALDNICLKDEYRVLVPLKNAGKRVYPACKKSGANGIDDCACCSNWNNAYQHIKHNRAMSLKWASVKHLLDAIGALFILNLYYRWHGEIIVNRSNSFDEFDYACGSKLFIVTAGQNLQDVVFNQNNTFRNGEFCINVGQCIEEYIEDDNGYTTGKSVEIVKCYIESEGLEYETEQIMPFTRLQVDRK